MPGKKILWLCSWYPDRTEPFNGDFIQRHANAAAIFNDIYVVHVTGDASGKTNALETSFTTRNHLSEFTVRFPKTNSLYGRFTGHLRLLDNFRKAADKYIREQGKPDLIHVHVPVWAGIIALELKKKWGIPFIVSEHWGIYNDVELNNYSTKSARFKRKSRQILENASAFTSVSRFLAEGVNRRVAKKEYSIIHNTVNTALFYFKQKSSDVFRFIHVSNMVPLKNAPGILKAFRSLLDMGQNAELLMIGDTDPAIRNFAADLGLEDKVEFKGEIPYKQVAAAMQDSDVLILFSNIENSPCVISEALCCGLPVIATAVGGIPELISKENGILIQPRDEKALADTMKHMQERYADFNKEKIATEARNKFSYEVIGKNFDELYEKLLAVSL